MLPVRVLNLGGKVEKKKYTAPQLSDWGAIAQVTQVGFTHPGADCLPNGKFMGGSVENKNTTCDAP